jgi:hypothetical protein
VKVVGSTLWNFFVSRLKCGLVTSSWGRLWLFKGRKCEVGRECLKLDQGITVMGLIYLSSWRDGEKDGVDVGEGL